MNRKSVLSLSLLALTLGGMTVPAILHSPAHAEPAQPKPGANPMADLLRGRLYPTSLSRDQMKAEYRRVALVDAQGKTGAYASKGDTMTIGGQVFLVVYILPDAPKTPPGDSAAPEAPAQLALINLSHVQALGGIGEMPPIAPPAKSTETP